MNIKQFKNKINQEIIMIPSIILCCLIWLWIIYEILNSLFSPIHPNYEYEFKEYVISNGERLWDIAEEELESNTYYKNEDVRQVVYEIQKDNNISGNVFPGQVIKIRIKKDGLSNTTDQSAIR